MSESSMNPDAFNHKKPDLNPPEGYFDNFELSLMTRIHQQEKEPAWNLYRLWRSYAAAACISAILLTAGWNLKGIMQHSGVNIISAPRETALQVPDPENVILNDEELLEWIEQPVQVNSKHPDDRFTNENPANHLLTTDDLIEAGLIEPEDPALNIEGIF